MQRRLIVFVALLCAMPAVADEWTRFRGPNGTGIAPPLDIPNTWTESDFAWQVDLPGTGHGSPVVWQDHVYLTSGDSQAGTAQLLAYNVATGEPVWSKSHRVSPYGMHTLNAIASTTPAVDAQHVYFTYYTPGNVALVAYQHDGTEAWRAELGEFSSEHGFAASPIVVNNLVCLQGDNAEAGYVAAFDSQTGDERWRAERAASSEAYSTPAIIQLADARTAVVYSSTSGGVTAVDAASGQTVWQQADALPARTVSSPIVAGNLVLAACGSGGNGKQLVALRTTGKGQVEPAYKLTKNVPYVPTGIVAGDLLFLVHERGTMSCFELTTGQELWTKRLGAKYYCSPILLGDRLLCVSMDGEAIMLAAGRRFEVLGRTDLGEGTEATPAVADGRLFIRTASKLFCLAE